MYPSNGSGITGLAEDKAWKSRPSYGAVRVPHVSSQWKSATDTGEEDDETIEDDEIKIA